MHVRNRHWRRKMLGAIKGQQINDIEMGNGWNNAEHSPGKKNEYYIRHCRQLQNYIYCVWANTYIEIVSARYRKEEYTKINSSNISYCHMSLQGSYMMLEIKKMKKQKNVDKRTRKRYHYNCNKDCYSSRLYLKNTFFVFLVITWRVFYMMEELCLGSWKIKRYMKYMRL